MTKAHEGRSSGPYGGDKLSEWQPIETAPVGNGSNPFLAHITGHGCCVCFKTPAGLIISRSGRGLRQIHNATHWMPLPEPPVQS